MENLVRAIFFNFNNQKRYENVIKLKAFTHSLYAMYPSCRSFEQRYVRDIKLCYKASHLCPHSTVRKMKLYLIESYFNINNVNLALLTTPYILSVVQYKPIVFNLSRMCFAHIWVQFKNVDNGITTLKIGF